MDKIYKNYVPTINEYISESIVFSKEYDPNTATADINKASSDLQNEFKKLNADKQKLTNGNMTPIQYRDSVKRYIDKQAQYNYLTMMNDSSSYFKNQSNNSYNNNNNNNQQQNSTTNNNTNASTQQTTQQNVAKEVGTAMGGNTVGNAFANAVNNQ